MKAGVLTNSRGQEAHLRSHGKQEVNGDELEEGGGLWLSDGLTACTDIREEPESVWAM